MKTIRKGIEDELQFGHFFDPSMPIFHVITGITYPNPDYEMQRFDEPNYTFEYIIEGKCAVQIDDNIFTAEAGDAIIFPPSTFQHFYSDKKNPIKKIWVIFNYDLTFIEMLVKAYHLEGIMHVKNVSHTKIPSILENIVYMVRDRPSDFARRLEIEIHRLIGEISDSAAFQNEECSIAELGKRHIDRMLNMHFTIDDICKMVGTSRSQFFRSFKKEFGTSPTAYIINQKINLSKQILTESNASITDIANSFDFSNVAHYSSTFKRIVGCTPLEYRKSGGACTRHTQRHTNPPDNQIPLNRRT